MSVFYHGSPEGALQLDHRTFFVTKDRKVAESYALGNTFTRSIHTVGKNPTIYELRLFGLKTLDLRISLHQELYDERRVEFNSSADPDDMLPRRASPGFIQRSGLPGYGRIELLRQAFPEFNSLLVDEGSQGISTALFDARHTCQIVQKTRL